MPGASVGPGAMVPCYETCSLAPPRMVSSLVTPRSECAKAACAISSQGHAIYTQPYTGARCQAAPVVTCRAATRSPGPLLFCCVARLDTSHMAHGTGRHTAPHPVPGMCVCAVLCWETIRTAAHCTAPHCAYSGEECHLGPDPDMMMSPCWEPLT